MTAGGGNGCLSFDFIQICIVGDFFDCAFLILTFRKGYAGIFVSILVLWIYLICSRILINEIDLNFGTDYMIIDVFDFGASRLVFLMYFGWAPALFMSFFAWILLRFFHLAINFLKNKGLKKQTN